ncbi:MAG: hypothetical protein APF80_10240 [Alphaproteobacteria bacterium BRH_c36]|nr:MAG: hypothetical protein APF80_10240 [Alphaproteobacteria bacterium BRH_c36]
MSIATRIAHEIPSALAVAKEVMASVSGFFSAFSRANSAAHAYDRLNHLSDAQLAARGLSREMLGEYISDMYLTD